jgi:tRNA G18 (ribose-2'-O)-methylase SpoU
MKLVTIESLSDPRVAPYANLRDAELAQRADPLNEGAHGGLFIAEGELVAKRLIRSRFRTRSVLTTRTRLETMRDVLGRLEPETPVYVVEQAAMDQIVGFNMHRGVLAVGERGEPWPPQSLLQREGPMVVLEDLTNHDNLGGVFRNAAALGGPGVSVLLSPRCVDPLYRKSLRVSMGLVLSVPFARAARWPEGLGDLRQAGYEVWGMTPREDAVGLREAVRARGNRKVALVMGSEGPGLTQAAMSACDRLVQIEMDPSDSAVDSLNVGMAAGIGLYALGRGDGRAK